MQAKLAQVDQIKNYVGGCREFFEQCIAELLLKQPKDPHGHLVEFLNEMSVEEREQWSYGMKDLVKDNSGGAGAGTGAPAAKLETPPIPETGNLQVVLRLRVDEDDEKAWPAVVQLLEDLRRNGKAMPGCIHFEIYECRAAEEVREVLILQTWESQLALDDFHKATFFTTSTGAFDGLLAEPPNFSVYRHHKPL